ncbi:armadillo repeat-containing protein 3-like [Amphibalanus amphitrite]|uniref:armadillo repeat-containing protein 3-like n=2 Tax=Amphibalanus amphitrite TaxID=1232801 RepID=UPI001C91B7CA|nr:armadillo repeat-containing protein 3-like [Amphibalanus amphitrite]XP_043210263.1 armadillo repeat-containing protein 3-like [Amphibalanus amphitrite]XP_043210264.1 armadillo repeat-containing protein 3-like [Amphibalanus amphitrite]XP_043212945.1 armadillo repeat-containing protein 3-like [Amphibalanus amphitrite]
MPLQKGEAVEPGRVEPPFQWETHIPHTVALMLNATEEDLVLKSCQSLYKFAHEAEVNQQLLLQYDILRLLLDHLGHSNRSVRRMAAMTLCQLAGNATVQTSFLADGGAGGLTRLIERLVADDDPVVDEFVSGALFRVASQPVGQAALLVGEAVPALTHRLTSSDPDVLKNCLDTLLAVLQDFQAVPVFVDSSGIERALALVRVEPPVLVDLALEALRKAMYTEQGRRRLREIGGLEDLLTLLEEDTQEAHAARIVAVLEHATLDPKSVRSMHRNGGLLLMVQTARNSSDPQVLAQCGEVLGHLGSDRPCALSMRELGAEAVIVGSLLSSTQPAAQRGGARALAAFALLPEAQEEMVNRGAVPILLNMIGVQETIGPAAAALAAITRGHENACRQAAEGLAKIVDRLSGDCDETAAHAATALANMAGQESVRPMVATSRACDRLLACLGSGSAPLLVAVCEALGVISMSLRARHALVEHHSVNLILNLLKSDYPAVRSAAVEALQMQSADPAAAEQLCADPDAIAALRRLRATSALKVILQVNISALYSQFGRLTAYHRLTDGFFDVGRGEDGDVLPDLITELERPPCPGRFVFLLNSGVCPARVDAAGDDAATKAAQQSPPRRSPRRTDRGARGTSPVSERPPARPVPPEDPRLAAYVSYVRQTVAPLDCELQQAAELAQFVADRMGGTVSRDQLPTWSAERQLSELRRQRASNVLPVGEVSRGGLRCRALLFKFLADQINVPCTLTRGSFGKYWNSVFVTDRSRGAPAGAYAEKVVDLIHQPGTLMTVGTGDAVSYTTGF